MTSPRKEQSPLGELFQACDLDGSGYIDKDELANICPDLTPEEIDNIFAELDGNGDGSISVTEFTEGFKGLSSSLLGMSRASMIAGAVSPGSTKDTSLVTLDNNNDKDLMSEDEWQGDADTTNVSQKIVEELGELGVSVNEDLITTLSCQEQVCELYQSLHHSEEPQLLAQFEDIILSVIKDIRQHQCEYDRLEGSFKKEKDNHIKQIQELEEELEHHMNDIESKIRRQERDKLESEKIELKASLEAEIAEMQSNMSKLHEAKESPNNELKCKLDEVSHENRFLQSNLTDAQTQLALLRSELATIKQNYEEKCYELQNEKQTLEGYLKEQDNLSRQVYILHDANKKLHDTNDDLRSALDTSRSIFKKNLESRTSPPISRGEYVKQYLNSPKCSSPASAANSSLADELSMMEGPKRKLLPVQDSCEIDSLPEDFDSGHSTMVCGPDLDSEYDEPDNRYTRRKRNHMLRGTSACDSTTESEMLDGPNDFDTEIDVPDDEDDDDLSVCAHSRCSNCSRSSSRASMRSTGSRRQNSMRRVLPNPPKQIITKEPERMYKVVLAGDAAVGKSSFILRLCKDKFISNLNSTLGVDFQTKTIELDGRVIALQLWDTAGQERHRSITQSYFRRCDGVFLLYDCSYVRSYLNVRRWVNSIEESANKKLPIMFVANKTDLRDEFINDGRKCIKVVETEEGQRLAREYDGLFIETSAKKGDNIVEAVTELARLMRANEDLEVQNCGLHLQEIKTKENKLVNCCTL